MCSPGEHSFRQSVLLCLNSPDPNSFCSFVFQSGMSRLFGYNYFYLVINRVYRYIKSSVMWPSSVGIYTPTAQHHNPEGLTLQQHAVITWSLAGKNIRLGYYLGAGTVTRQRAGRSTRRGPLPRYWQEIVFFSKSSRPEGWTWVFCYRSSCLIGARASSVAVNTPRFGANQ